MCPLSVAHLSISVLVLQLGVVSFKPDQAQKSFYTWPAAAHLLHPVDFEVVGFLVAKGSVNGHVK